jgi:hypothetical protein
METSSVYNQNIYLIIPIFAFNMVCADLAFQFLILKDHACIFIYTFIHILHQPSNCCS